MSTAKQKERRRANRRLKKDRPREPTRSSFPTIEELERWHTEGDIKQLSKLEREQE